MPEALGARLAAWASSLRYEDLPAPVVEGAKRLMLDTLSVAWAGSACPGIPELHAQVATKGGAAESAAWAFGGRLPATQAAFVNGAMAAALDFDTVHDLAGSHSDIVVLPAVLALADRERLAGREFLAAYAAGSEVLVRLSLALSVRPGWFYSSVLGVFGAAAASARAMRLDAMRTRHAMGVALSRAAGTQLTLVERSLTKRLQSAFAARDGVEAAELAAIGVTAPERMFEGAGGFSSLYGEVDAAKALDGLGRDWTFTALTFKKHASCYCNHAAIEAALQLVERQGVRAGAVEKVTVRLTPFMARLVGGDYAPGDNPQVAAQFSARYSVASVLARGRFAVDDILPSAATDPAVRALASNVEIEVDESQPGKFLPATVRVRTRDGRALEATVTELAGTPSKPFGDADLRAKALACLAGGVRPLARDAAERFASRIAAVESASDMREWFATL